MSTNTSRSKDVIDPAIPPGDLSFEWSVRIWGRNEEVANIKGRTIYPQALHPEYYGQTIIDFPNIFEALVTKPVLTTLTRKARLLFEEEVRVTEERIKAEQERQYKVRPVPQENTRNHVSPLFHDAAAEDQLNDHSACLPRTLDAEMKRMKAA